MGGCISSQSNVLQLNADKQNPRGSTARPGTVLILGEEGSGKTTLHGVLRLALGEGFSEAERLKERNGVYDYTLSCAQALCRMMRMESDCCLFWINERAHFPAVEKFQRDPLQLYGLSDIGGAIRSVFKDPSTKEFMEIHSWRLPENTAYFCENAGRIGAPHYIPNDGDILLSRRRNDNGLPNLDIQQKETATLNFIEANINDTLRWKNPALAGMKGIVLCISLAEYDKPHAMRKHHTCLHDSLETVGVLARSEYLPELPIIVLLNKLDVFREKLLRVPLKNYFKSYHGTDSRSAETFILEEFVKRSHGQRRTFVYMISAIDINMGQSLLADLYAQGALERSP